LTTGHRGRGKNPLTNIHENTLFSIGNMLQYCDGSEIDLNMTHDKELVINHDLGVDSKFGKLSINSLHSK
jgi:glycerophosphoryl diester phosphodiesterase